MVPYSLEGRPIFYDEIEHKTGGATKSRSHLYHNNQLHNDYLCEISWPGQVAGDGGGCKQTP